MIELLTFRLVEGADEPAFVEADGRVQTHVAYQQPGLARRTLARGEDGRWLVLTIWHSEEQAASAQQAFEASDDVAAMMRLVEPSSVDRQQFGSVPQLSG